MNSAKWFRFRNVIKNMGTQSILASMLMFLLTVAATFAGGCQLYRSTKESIYLQGAVNAVKAAKEFDGHLLVRKNTVILAGHVVDDDKRGKAKQRDHVYGRADLLYRR